jgi:hypothetical protein
MRIFEGVRKKLGLSGGGGPSGKHRSFGLHWPTSRLTLRLLITFVTLIGSGIGAAICRAKRPQTCYEPVTTDVDSVFIGKYGLSGDVVVSLVGFLRLGFRGFGGVVEAWPHSQLVSVRERAKGLRQKFRQSPAFPRSNLKMCKARVIASCSFLRLGDDSDNLRDRSRIAASATSIRCSDLLRSDSMMAER